MKIVKTLRSRSTLAATAGLALSLVLACTSTQQETKTAEETNTSGGTENAQDTEQAQGSQARGSEQRASTGSQGSSGGSHTGASQSGGSQAGSSGSGSQHEAQPAAQEWALVNVPEGKNITVSLNEPLSSKTSQVGQTFTATVRYDVQTREHPDVIIPAGSVVSGQIVEAHKASQLKGQAKLVVKFDDLKLPSGKVVPIVASLGAEGADTGNRTAGAIAGGAAAGAILGKIIGKDSKDAAIGAVAGAAIGTGVVLGLDNKDVELPAGTDLVLNVDQQVQIPVQKTGA